MTKQEFLAMSLPYGLRIQNSKETDIIISICGDEVYSLFRGHLHNTIEVTDIKPILHPLSDLTKEIEHKGEKFVPIVELAKMANLTPFTGVARREYKEDNKAAFVDCKHLEHHGIKQRFAYFNDYGFRTTLDGYRAFKQFELFQKLIEWKFDIAGLIEKGEAIDVNILEANPYK